mmetsp:Transcript_14928/g.30441  ORF Transcript_14928/g.30441 Transcript_14928/m.30441 type:complete len:248 (+) Transcript_14928:79-822(+)
MFKSLTFLHNDQLPSKESSKDLKNIVFDIAIFATTIFFIMMSFSPSPMSHFEGDIMLRSTIHASSFGIEDSQAFQTLFGVPEYNRTYTDELMSLEDSSESTEAVFQVGDIVEVYDPSIHASYAFAAKIKKVINTNDGSTFYDILPGYGKGDKDIINHVRSSVVNEMKLYTPDTKAACDVGTAESRHFVQCKILSHLKSNLGGNNGGWYMVSYQLGSNDALKRTKLPLSKVQRIIRDIAAEQLVVEPQ